MSAIGHFALDNSNQDPNSMCIYIYGVQHVCSIKWGNFLEPYIKNNYIYIYTQTLRDLKKHPTYIYGK